MPRTPAPKSAPRTVRAAAAAAGDPPAYDIRFGIILNINGKSVPVTSGDVGSAIKNGVEFTLQDPLELGTIEQFESWVSGKFSVNLPQAKDLPTPLDSVVGAITGMHITVEKAHVKVPGTASDPKTVGVTLEVNGTFSPEIVLIQDKLGIQGMVFGFSNEASES
jgi:hypothetical protein